LGLFEGLPAIPNTGHATLSRENPPTLASRTLFPPVRVALVPMLRGQATSHQPVYSRKYMGYLSTCKQYHRVIHRDGKGPRCASIGGVFMTRRNRRLDKGNGRKGRRVSRDAHLGPAVRARACGRQREETPEMASYPRRGALGDSLRVGCRAVVPGAGVVDSGYVRLVLGLMWGVPP